MFALDNYYENVVKVGFVSRNRGFDVQFIFPKEKLLEAMAVVNYLNGGDGHVIEKERWDALDARSYTRQEQGNGL